MNGTVAWRLSDQMNTEASYVRRGISTPLESINSFQGYLKALRDFELINQDDSEMFSREFCRMVIGG